MLSRLAGPGMRVAYGQSPPPAAPRMVKTYEPHIPPTFFVYPLFSLGGFGLPRLPILPSEAWRQGPTPMLTSLPGPRSRDDLPAPPRSGGVTGLCPRGGVTMLMHASPHCVSLPRLMYP